MVKNKSEFYEVNLKAEERQIAKGFLQELFEEAIKNVLPAKVDEILDQLQGKLFTEEDTFTCRFEVSFNGLGLLVGVGLGKRKNKWREKV